MQSFKKMAKCCKDFFKKRKLLKQSFPTHLSLIFRTNAQAVIVNWVCGMGLRFWDHLEKPF